MPYRFILKKASIAAEDEYFYEKPSWKLLASKINEKFNISPDNLVLGFVHNGKEVTIKDNSTLQLF